MRSNTIRHVMTSAKPPLHFFTSDGLVVYVDHPESVILSEHLIAIGSGADAGTGLAKEIILDHVVRIDNQAKAAS